MLQLINDRVRNSSLLSGKQLWNPSWALLTRSANDKCIGNWSYLNSKSIPECSKGKQTIKSSSPSSQTDSLVTGMTFLIKFLTTGLVPLYSFGWEKLRRTMIGWPVFNGRQWEGATCGGCKFKNSKKKVTIFGSSEIYLQLEENYFLHGQLFVSMYVSC